MLGEGKEIAFAQILTVKTEMSIIYHTTVWKLLWLSNFINKS